MTKYANRLHHVRHDADSYARELRAAVIAVFSDFSNPVVACYPFSIGYEDFAERTGLNMHGIRRLGFPRTWDGVSYNVRFTWDSEPLLRMLVVGLENSHTVTS